MQSIIQDDRQYLIDECQDVIHINKYMLKEITSEKHSLYFYANMGSYPTPVLGYGVMLDITKQGLDVTKPSDMHIYGIGIRIDVDRRYFNISEYRVQIHNNLNNICTKVRYLYGNEIAENVEKYFVVQELLN